MSEARNHSRASPRRFPLEQPRHRPDHAEAVPARHRQVRSRATACCTTLRFDASGNAREDFVFNKPEYAGARILSAARTSAADRAANTPCGACSNAGFDAVIAPSFAEIFYFNAMNNRLLLVALPTEVVEELMALSEQPDAPDISIDVESRTVRWGVHAPVPFPISTATAGCSWKAWT